MTRARTLPDPPPYADLFGTPESPPQATPESHTTRQGHDQEALRAISKAFRACEDARTLAWVAVEHGNRLEAIRALRVFEEAVIAARQMYERG